MRPRLRATTYRPPAWLHCHRESMAHAATGREAGVLRYILVALAQHHEQIGERLKKLVIVTGNVTADSGRRLKRKRPATAQLSAGRMLPTSGPG